MAINNEIDTDITRKLKFYVFNKNKWLVIFKNIIKLDDWRYSKQNIYFKIIKWLNFSLDIF